MIRSPRKDRGKKRGGGCPDEVLQRDKAWAATPYPCFGLWTFTRIHSFTSDPLYGLVVSRLTAASPSPGPGSSHPPTEEKLLDLGCGIGQNIRQLAYAGVPPSRLLAVDLHQELLDIGFEMFLDRDKLAEATFLTADVLKTDNDDDDDDEDNEGLRALRGQATMIHAANFFHLFSWEQQVVAGINAAQFLRADAEEAFVFGRHIGSLKPGKRVGPTIVNAGARDLFMHDQTTFQALWDEVGKATGTTWTVEVGILRRLAAGFEFLGEGARFMSFVAKRSRGRF